MNPPQRIALSRRAGFDLQKHSIALNGLAALVVTRVGPWGNPFRVGLHGDKETCVRLFAELCNGKISRHVDGLCQFQQAKFLEHAKKHLHELAGYNLACWCADEPCHATVLLEAANDL